MKYKLGSIVLIWTILSACGIRNLATTVPAPLQPTQTATVQIKAQPLPTSIPIEAIENGAELYEPGLITNQQPVLQKMDSANVYQMNLVISEDYHTVNALQTLHITNQENTSLDALYFHLFVSYAGGNIIIHNARVNQLPAKTSLLENGAILRISLDQSLPIGSVCEVTLEYTLEVPDTMGGNYGLFGYFEDVLVLDTFYPMLAVYDQSGWQAEPPDPVGDLTYTDASYYQVEIQAPADLTLVASGIQVADETSGDRQTVRFVAGPARDFYLAGSTRYTKWSRQVGEVTINSYAFKENETAALLVLDTAAAAIEIFSNQFIPYPYTEFDVISSPMRALGIEYPGIVGIGLDMYKVDENGGVPAAMNLESVVVHEVAHQWFYNLVGNDQSNLPWVDESITQYATSLYYQERYNNSAAAAYRQSWESRWARVNSETIPIGMPAREYEGADYSAIIYGRGPFFLVELEKSMGKETFSEFLKQYVTQYQWQNTDTEVFRRLAESTCNCDLGALFAEWVYP
jgi:hypothetical protein